MKEKELELITFREFEITTELIALTIKAPSPKLVTELGITTDFRSLYAKASVPILVTEFGIETEVIFEDLNARKPILLTDGSIIKCPVQPLLLVIEAAGISTE